MIDKRDIFVVTGAAGFIGSHLCEKLLGLGARVRAIDSLTDYYDPRRKRENLSGVIDDHRFEFLEEDLNSCDMNELLEGTRGVFHLAAQAGVRRSWGAEFSFYVESNIQATQRLLEALRTREGVKLVYSSSSSVYGQAERLPMKEGDPLRPMSPYGVTKLSGENLCELYRRNFGIDTASLRYFTVYGPRQRPDMAFSRFIGSIMKRSRIEVYGDGSQTRDFTYVSDAVEANLLAMRYRGGESIFNIGGGSRISILEVIDILAEKTGLEPDIDFQEKAKGDVRDTFADTAKARDELGFAPAVGFEDGIQKEIEWYEKYFKENKSRETG